MHLDVNNKDASKLFIFLIKNPIFLRNDRMGTPRFFNDFFSIGTDAKYSLFSNPKKKLENYKATPFHVLAFQGRANVYAHK